VGAAVATLVGAAVVAYLGVSSLAPGPDPGAVRDQPLDHADVTAQSFAAVALVAVAMIPLGLIRIIDLPAQLTGPAGTATLAAVMLGYAASLWWVVGAVTGSNLEKRAPELLHTMRAGRAPAAVRGGRLVTSLPRWRQALLWASIIAAGIALFPQAVVPAAMKATGNVERLWFLALYAPRPWQWTVITAMSLLGLGLYVTAYRTYRSAQRGSHHTGSTPDTSRGR
jgi:ABC-2 type transport system permease protein